MVHSVVPQATRRPNGPTPSFLGAWPKQGIWMRASLLSGSDIAQAEVAGAQRRILAVTRDPPVRNWPLVGKRLGKNLGEGQVQLEEAKWKLKRPRTGSRKKLGGGPRLLNLAARQAGSVLGESRVNSDGLGINLIRSQVPRQRGVKPGLC